MNNKFLDLMYGMATIISITALYIWKLFKE